jgi:hypothetical protein
MNDEQKHALARFIKTAPERICLNVADHIDDIDHDKGFSKELSLHDMTWSTGPMGAIAVDVPYVRADLVPTWTPIDQIPDEWKDGREVLLTVPKYNNAEAHGHLACIGYFNAGNWEDREEGNELHTPTHAMPLPTPPKDGGLER